MSADGDELGGALDFAPRLARLMAKELAATFNVERSELAQQRAEDDALSRYCRLSQDEIVRLRALPFTTKQRALQIAGRVVAVLMLGDTCWLAADGDVQTGIMPDDVAGAQQSNIALAIGGIVADELVANTAFRVAAVRGRATLSYLDLCEPARVAPSAVFDCFRRYYAEQFLPHTAAIAALAGDLCRTQLTSQDFAEFSRRWNLQYRLTARAA